MKQINMAELREQPVARLKINAESEKVTARLEYEISEEDWLSNIPALYSPHPDFPALSLIDIDCPRLPGFRRRIICSYESTLYEFLGVDDPPSTYAEDVALTEEPILTHPRYSELEDDERRVLKALINGHKKDEKGASLEPQITSEMGLELLAKIKKGRVTYKAPTQVWREKKTRKELPAVEGIGKIATPPGPVPSLEGAMNWMFMGSNSRQHTDKNGWDIESVWQASGPDGHDEDLYGVEA